jgi:VWFA-related protein
MEVEQGMKVLPMPGFRVLLWRSASVVALIAGLGVAGDSWQARAQSNSGATPADQAANPLKVESDLVVVRIVVRDAQGIPVKGLKKEDFKLFDRGKEQSIAQFEEESPVEAAATLSALQTSSQPGGAHDRYIALYFDDLDTSDGDLMAARDAADRYLAANLHASDHAAIFTTGRILSDFTSDPKQLHAALLQLHASGRNLARVHECPDLTDYQSQQILENDDQHSDVWMEALAEVKVCAPPPDPRDTPASIRMLAQRIMSMAQAQARENLDQFAKVVSVMTQAPGVRTAILVSPGFLSESEQLALDRIIDRAVRSQVVINSLDPKGLAALTREGDASRSGTALPSPKATQARHNLDAEREFVGSDVLAEVAQGTGGEFIRNNNDLQAGFEKLAGHPAEYTLAFAPRDLKLDGKFHALKVEMAEKRKGYSILARKGYFAVAEAPVDVSAQPKSAMESAPASRPAVALPADAQLPAVQPKTADPVEQEKEQIQGALRAKTDSTGLAAAIDASPSEGGGETRSLAATVHLDAKSLPLRKDGDHSLDTLIFAVAVFDGKDNVVAVKQRGAHVNLQDQQLPGFFDAGVDVNMMFEVKPGNYRLRVVVYESNESRMAAFSRDVAVP